MRGEGHGLRWGLLGALLLSCRPTAPATSGGPDAPVWHCTDIDLGYGICLRSARECEAVRAEAQGRFATPECRPEEEAWCFFRPHALSSKAYCTPTPEGCGRARKQFKDQSEEPPRNCERYLDPTQ